MPGTLANLDWFAQRMRIETAAESHFGGEAVKKLSLTPSEYFARNCWIGASFIRPIEAALRHEVGVERIMWGSDYPHSEGSYPHSREALRASFATAPEAEVRAMLGETAAAVYGFDLDALDAIAGRVGPTVAEIAVPLDAFPRRLDLQRVRPRRDRPHLVTTRDRRVPRRYVVEAGVLGASVGLRGGESTCGPG